MPGIYGAPDCIVPETEPPNHSKGKHAPHAERRNAALGSEPDL